MKFILNCWERENMSKLFLHDKRGIVSWLLNQIGLLVATGILLGAIISLLYSTEWQRKAEIENIASDFASVIQSVSLKEFPEKITYRFPEKRYNYEIEISTDYITLRIDDEGITVKKKMYFSPWINPPCLDGYGSKGFFNYLSNKYGKGNNGSSPQNSISLCYIEKEFNFTARELALNPFIVDVKRPVYIEKILLYTEEGERDYVIIYQG